jgi:subtilase family serine protease
MGRFGALRQFFMLTAIALIVGIGRSAAADGPATILDGNHPDEAADVVGAAAASPSQPLAMRLTMALRNRDDLAKLLADQQDPSSAQYHRWLSPDAFTSRFGPTDADLARVSRWLKKKGFTVDSADASTREVSFTGTVAQAQNVFGVKIAATTDGLLYSNISDPSVPAELAPVVESIHGLDNLLHSMPLARRVSKPEPSATSPASVVNNAGPAFGPPDIYTFYNETPLLNENIDGGGTGTRCIAVVEDSNIDAPAADAFNTQFGLPALTGINFSTMLVDNTDPGLNADEDETMVDVTYAHAVAPGSSIRIYLGDQKHTSSSAILDAIHASVTEKNSPCSAISISFSFCGGSKGFYKTQNGFFAQAASQGQSVFIATGDDGAAGLKLNSKGCVAGTSRNVNEIGASPNVTAIGGTEFTPNYLGGNDDGFVSETVWNDSDGAAGGGQSKFFKKPAFQKGLIKKDKNRDVPDISFGASPATPGFFYGGRNGNTPAVLCCIGGTSLGAPAWAGTSQLISQLNNAPIGNLNARIYQLGALANGAMTGIRDVTSGNTNFNGVTGFSATTGYDKASGWGTVDMGLFVPAYLGP